MYHIQVVGAGYTGSAIAHFFHNKKQKVTVIKRTSRDAEKYEGMNVIQCDLRNKDSIPQIPPANFVVIALAPDERTEAAYQATYIDAVKNYLASIQGWKPYLIVYLSSTGVYGESLEGVIDESTIPKPETERARILLKAEEQVLNSGFPSIVFRLGGIYGPERNRIQSFREKKWSEPHAEKWMNMIHVQDIVEAMPVLFKSAQTGQVYLGVDDLPVLESDFYTWLSEKLRIDFPKNILLPGKKMGKRYNNSRLKSLGVQLKFPSFREGYTVILESESHV